MGERRPNGQFEKGNQAAKGNRGGGRLPRAKEDELAGILFSVVTPDEFRTVCEVLLSRAKSGDTRAMQILLDRLLGRAVERHEVMGKDGGPIETKQVVPDLSTLSDEELSALAGIVGKLEGGD